MSVLGMSDLVASMVASADVSRIDVRDHSSLHAALVHIKEQRAADPSRHLPDLEVRPDPEVGRRVDGVTKALWALVAAGVLRPVEEGARAWFVVEPERNAMGRRAVMRLDDSERLLLQEAAAIWATALDTSRKNERNSAGPASAPGRVSRASRVHVSESARRHRASKRTLPA